MFAFRHLSVCASFFLVASLASNAAAQSSQSGAVTGRVADLVQDKIEQGVPDGLTSVAMGFFVTENGYVVANAHTVVGCKQLSVTNQYGKILPARVLVIDATTDSALLKTAHYSKHFLTPSSDAPKSSDVAALITYSDTLRAGSQDGAVSFTPQRKTARFLGRRINDPDFYDFTVDLGKGDSGAPILDDRGHVSAMLVGRNTRNGQSTAIALAGRHIIRLLNFAGVNIEGRPAWVGLANGRRQTNNGWFRKGQFYVTEEVLNSASAAVVKVSCR